MSFLRQEHAALVTNAVNARNRRDKIRRHIDTHWTPHRSMHIAVWSVLVGMSLVFAWRYIDQGPVSFAAALVLYIILLVLPIYFFTMQARVLAWAHEWRNVSEVVSHHRYCPTAARQNLPALNVALQPYQLTVATLPVNKLVAQALAQYDIGATYLATHCPTGLQVDMRQQLLLEHTVARLRVVAEQ